MPWTAKTFAARHNHKLHGAAASEAAKQATGMVRAGVPEGIAIATANKHGDQMQKGSPKLPRRQLGGPEPVKSRDESGGKPVGSPRSRDEHMRRKAKHMPQKQVAREFGVHPSTVSRTMRKGFTYEGSAADRAADRRNAKKAGVSVKEWEGSPADERADARARKAMAEDRPKSPEVLRVKKGGGF